tara:strand:- start:32 stop:430 length:399 start_codon:yes stop_codon:yes gene_type:complete
MGLKRTKLLGIQAITGISTVGILTVGTTQTAGGVGIASTTYLRGAIFHNTGLGSCSTGLYVYPSDASIVGHGASIYRLMNIDLQMNETFFFEMNYPLVLTDQEKIVVDVRQNASGHGIGTAVNVQILGDTDI